MNIKEFYQTLGARSGLGLDAQTGTIGGTSNGFVVNAISEGSKLNLVLSPVKDGNHPSIEEIRMLTTSITSISDISYKGQALLFTLTGATHNMNGITQTADAIFSLTKALKDAGYEDDSEANAADMELRGKEISVSGPNDYSYIIRGAMGAIAGLLAAVIIMLILSSVFPVIVGFISSVVLLILPVLGFELFKGKRSVIGLIVLLITLLVGVELLVRIQTATEVYCNYRAVSAVTSAYAPALLALDDDPEYAQTIEKLASLDFSVSEIFWDLPLTFNARGDFLSDLIVGYIEAAILFVVTCIAYYKGHSGVVDYILWIFASVTGRRD